MRSYLVCASLVGLLIGAPVGVSPAYAEETTVERGEYLTQLLGCGRCHTEGELLGRRDGPWLAGSTIGIAYTDSLTSDMPGIVFPRNLTPDVETGIGGSSKIEIVRMIRSGIDHEGEQLLTVMPWLSYGMLNDEDASAIVEYLMSLAPVSRKIPENVPEGQATELPYVRFGIYTFRLGEMTGQQTLPIDRR